jgi:NADPH:quinone reductase-like Zn-dependent oxidoreductase
VVTEVGAGVDGVSVGDEVIGYTDERASHAELVAVDAGHLTPRPAAVPWEVAGSLYVVGATAYAAVRAVDLRNGDVVVVSGAAGGVGTLVVQLARDAGATVVALASEDHHDWLREHGAIPVTYGDGVAERIREAAGGQVDAFIDLFGSGYVDLAIELGVAPGRIDTIADPRAPERHPGVKVDGNMAGASPETLAALAALIAEGRLEVPIARVYPLAEVREAYTELERRHTLGKIVLRP